MNNEKLKIGTMLFFMLLMHLKFIVFILGFGMTAMLVFFLSKEFIYADATPFHAFILALVSGIAVGDSLSMLVNVRSIDSQSSDE